MAKHLAIETKTTRGLERLSERLISLYGCRNTQAAPGRHHPGYIPADLRNAA